MDVEGTEDSRVLFSPLPQNWQERQGQGCPHSGSLMLIREGGRGLILLLSTTWRIKSRLLSNWLRLSALSTTTSHSNHPVPVLVICSMFLFPSLSQYWCPGLSPAETALLPTLYSPPPSWEYHFFLCVLTTFCFTIAFLAFI